VLVDRGDPLLGRGALGRVVERLAQQVLHVRDRRHVVAFGSLPGDVRDRPGERFAIVFPADDHQGVVAIEADPQALPGLAGRVPGGILLLDVEGFPELRQVVGEPQGVDPRGGLRDVPASLFWQFFGDRVVVDLVPEVQSVQIGHESSSPTSLKRAG